MNLYSANTWMTKTAAELPDDEPVVLYMRHCERYDNPPDRDYSKLLLNPKGIKMANDIGASINRKIRFLRCSRVQRCRQTLEEIVKCVPPQFAPEAGSQIKAADDFCDMVGDSRPKEDGGVGWYEYYYYLQRGNIEATRGVSLEMETKHILDAIFEETLDSKEAAESKIDLQDLPVDKTGSQSSISGSQTAKTAKTGSQAAKADNGQATPAGSQAPLDLICSHDGHVVVLASALFDFKSEMQWTEDWCRFAEGIFFYGSRRNFTAIWRGESKKFTDYLL